MECHSKEELIVIDNRAKQCGRDLCVEFIGDSFACFKVQLRLMIRNERLRGLNSEFIICIFWLLWRQNNTPILEKTEIEKLQEPGLLGKNDSIATSGYEENDEIDG